MPSRRKNHDPSGLGRTILNKKYKDFRERHESGLFTTEVDSTTRLKSVTYERDLDEFLNTAQLAGTEFTAERRNVKIIQSPSGLTHNPHLLSDEEEQSTLKKHQLNKEQLRVPRRPPWTKSITLAQLDRQEKDSFLEWRRGLAQLQEADKFLLTPFERNIEVWRQLWRVLERSHLIVQIVDARNPLRFRCEDLESYVKDVEGAEGEAGTGGNKRGTLLLINKADLLTATQRRLWADYFDGQGIQYAFFSAANAAALQQVRRDVVAQSEETRSHEDGHREDNTLSNPDSPYTPRSKDSGVYFAEESMQGSPPHSTSETDDDHQYVNTEEDSPDGRDPRTKVLSVFELECLFVAAAPDLSIFTSTSGHFPTTLAVGLVGYPNVGKSSTINALLGAKKVSVSSTPGKTKHFQTIHLSSTIMLYDCPGLVFPQFATTKAALVCDGVLPIDQMREHTGPITLVVKRIPKGVLEACYGLNIKSNGVEEGGDWKITAEDFLVAYAIARGFMRSSQGNPDEARAARYILKDYVSGKLLFCHPPPGTPEGSFNQRSHESLLLRMKSKKRAPLTRVGKDADTYVPPNPSSILVAQGQGQRSQAIDREFFLQNSKPSARAFIKGTSRNGKEFSRGRIYPHQNIVANDGTPFGLPSAGLAGMLASAGGEDNGKKHNKKNKRVKQRSGKGYD